MNRREQEDQRSCKQVREARKLLPQLTAQFKSPNYISRSQTPAKDAEPWTQSQYVMPIYHPAYVGTDGGICAHESSLPRAILSRPVSKN